MSEGRFFSDPPPSSKLATRATLIITAAFVITPLVFHWLPYEISQWYHASARLKIEDDDLDAAREQVDKGLQWSENNDLLALKANWLIDNNDHDQAVALLERQLEYPLRDPNQLNLHLQYCDALLSDSHSKGQQQCEKVAQLWEGTASITSGNWFRSQPNQSRMQILNARAYQLAVANSDLETALQDTEKAIEMLGGSTFVLNFSQAAQYKKHQREFAESGKNIEIAESFRVSVIDPLESALLLLEFNAAKRWSMADKKYRDDSLIELKNWLIAANELYLEMLPQEGFDDVRSKVSAEVDHLSEGLEEVRPIAVPVIPTTPTSYHQILLNLDTRGYVHFRLKNYQIATLNLTASINLATQLMKSLESEQLVQYESLLKSLPKTLAILHYHRAQIFEKLERVELQKNDLEMVRQYGEEPHPTLF